MKFVNTKNRTQSANLKTALFQGQAPDKGLYIPETLPKLSDDFWQRLPGLSFTDMAFEVLWPFVEGTLDKARFSTLLQSAYPFDAPLVQITDHTYALELFHGPTLAFKDFGAQFLGHMIEALKEDNETLTILAATSGDTGSAVAHAFYKKQGINVVLLYPKGQVSPVQEQQLTTLGENITTLEVNGTFDDCQAMVKAAFADEALNKKITLSSANSINIGRLLPQSLYYIYAYGKCHDLPPVVFSVPSGNLGNLAAGVTANLRGLPVQKFISAQNDNHIFHNYLTSGTYTPEPSKRTLSNAMDVGNPSNIARLQAFFDDRVDALNNIIFSSHHTNEETAACIKEVQATHGYTLDPHGAVGYLALKAYRQTAPQPHTGLILETAHPAKFTEAVEEIIGTPPAMPQRLAECLQKPKQALACGPTYEDLKTFLLG